MKLTLALAVGLSLTSIVNAAALTGREEALIECIAQARAMGHVPKTATWTNSVKDCMVDHDINSG
jgi:hypothetical protein